jgi:hypothetical protein
MSLCVFDEVWGRLLTLLSASILQSTLAASQELPDAPSVVTRTGFYAAGDSATSADPQQSPGSASTDSSRGKFLTRWLKRGLRDQADIYTAPLHRSEMKRVIGLPLVTAGLIAIDKHASGVLPRDPSSASADISDVGLFATAGAVVRFSSTERPEEILMPSKPTYLEPRRWQTVASCMSCCNSLRSVNVLYKERVRDISFRPAAWIIHFPPAIRSSRGTAASTIAHEYPKPLGRVVRLRNRSGRFGDAIHQPATLPLRCCSGKHTWVLDRTPHLPCSLQGWSQRSMQCEIVQGNPASISRKREVTDV